MKIGIAYSLKPSTPHGGPDDAYEEFDSPLTIQTITTVLRERGHGVIELGDGKEFLRKVLEDPPELVFNIAEGYGISRNREARVPAVCEMLDIPYTGSDPLTLALCLDKDACRRTVEDADVVVPGGILVQFPDGEYDGDFAEFPAMAAESGLVLPLIAKPVCEGSSKGIRACSLIETPEQIGPVVLGLWRDYQQPVLVEEFIEGDEITVGLVGSGEEARVLGVMRVLPKAPSTRFVYSLEVKRDWENLVGYESPPALPPKTLRAIEEAALAAYDILGCRDWARLDFRVRDGVPYFLEANPLPGLNPESGDLVLLSQLLGIDYPQLIGTLLDVALKRLRL